MSPEQRNDQEHELSALEESFNNNSYTQVCWKLKQFKISFQSVRN
jgi:hypothetical protein